MLPRNLAKRRRYVQPQAPWLRVWMVFDVDRDGSWCAADEAGLPAPTWTAINRRNGHGHLAYGIDAPVRLERWGGRRGPANYLADIERAMVARLGADPSYSGFTCKNPLHRSWQTLWSEHPYSLGELHGWLGDLDAYHVDRVVGCGRNVQTFEHVRRWAYRLVLQHKADGGTAETWRMACIGAAEHFTAEHSPPLHRSECAWIGRSVSKWTWARFTAERFAEIQRARGAAGGRASGAVRFAGSLAERKPWEREGVSRRTWYRRRQRAAAAPAPASGTEPYQDNSTPAVAVRLADAPDVAHEAISG